MTTVISATELKNRVSEILNEVAFKGNVAVIERYGKPIAKMMPIEKKGLLSREEIRKVLDATFGSIPDFPDVRSSRYFRKRKVAFK